MASINANDAISLLGFYLALIALLTSIFFTRLESWYNEVKIAVKIWNKEDKENPDIKKTKDFQERIPKL